MFLLMSVILSTEGGLSQCMLGYYSSNSSRHPQEQTPPRWEQTPPTGSRHAPWDQALSAPVTPRAVHAGRYGQRAGGMHPTGMQSCCLFSFHSSLKFCFYIERPRIESSHMAMTISQMFWKLITKTRNDYREILPLTVLVSQGLLGLCRSM